MTDSTPFNLGSLAEPTQHHDPIVIENHSADDLQHYLKQMITIRKVEQRLALGRKEGDIGGPVHLGAGQEAIAVGVSASLQSTDRVFGAHRSHAHLLALNPDFYKLFAEVLGKQTGFSRGMGGSMHLCDPASGFYGSVPIVSGTVALAVGAAMAAKLQQVDDVSVIYFGDGAMEEGVIHESLNLARIQHAPVLFVVENNLFASHMHISLRQPSDLMSRFAVANDIPHKLIDGNDVVAVADAAKELISASRLGRGPGFLEVVTYRVYGHVDWRDDIDVGVHRSLKEVDNWRARDPISRLSTPMIKANIWTEEQEISFTQELNEQIVTAWEKAMNDPYPPASATLDRVYAAKP
ncbi:MAG: thiamine pyrophosphate-dependent dehydrogenase E1 component subunit alpha [Pseudomonadales bacterium]